MQRSWFTADRLAIFGLLLFTLLVRGTALWAMRANLEQDPDAYRQIAENLLQFGEFSMHHSYLGINGEARPIPTAYRLPLYPVVLSNLPAADGQHVSLRKVAALHLLLGVATVWLTWLTARRAGSAHHKGSLAIVHPTIAALLVACDLILLNQQSLIMTETLATFLAILSLWCLARFDANRSWFNAALAGGAIGLAILCRPTFLPWLALAALSMLLIRGRSPMERSALRAPRSPFEFLNDLPWRLLNAAALLFIAAAVLSPWAIRNYRVFGKPIITTTHGGYTLLLTNNELYYQWLQSGSSELPWSSAALDAKLTSEWLLWWHVEPQDQETAYDQWCYRQALLAIKAQPRMFVQACVYRIVHLWSPLPHKLSVNESANRRFLRYATGAWYCGLYVLATLGIWRLRWQLLQPPWLWGLLLCLTFTAVHTFYFTNIRMRAPLMPFVAIVAAAGLTRKPNVDTAIPS